MSVRIGDVTTWDTGCGACGQAKKLLEEAGEVVDAAAVLWGAENPAYARERRREYMRGYTARGRKGER